MADSYQKSSLYWTESRLLAAELMAGGKLTQADIAAKCGVSRSGLQKWLQDPKFREKVDAHLAEIAKRVFSRGLARCVNRVKAKNDRWYRLKHILAERAASAEMANVPGGKTGLLMKTGTKSIRVGDTVEVHHFYALDTGMLAAFLALEKDAAIECGQWAEKQEASAAAAPQFMDLTKLTDEQLNQLDAILAAARGHDDARGAEEAAAAADQASAG